MSTPYVGEDEGIALRLVGIIVVLVVALAVGIGVFKARPATTPAKTAMAPAAVLVEEDVAGLLVENGVVKFFFATASAELATGTNEALGELIKALGTGQLVVISGYHDATGDAALNEELAKKRALAVRDALLVLGVPEAGIELKKPELTTGSGSLREARRVEVLVR